MPLLHIMLLVALFADLGGEHRRRCAFCTALSVARAVAVKDNKLVRIRPFHVLKAPICPRLRECYLCFIVRYRCDGGVEAAVHIGEEIEPPNELVKCIVFCRPIE